MASAPQLCCLGSITPGRELVDTCDLVVGDLAQDPREPSLRINFIELGGFDEGVGDSHGFAAALRTREHPIFAANGHRLHGSLGGVVVQFQEAVVRDRVVLLGMRFRAYRMAFGQRRFAGYFGQAEPEATPPDHRRWVWPLACRRAARASGGLAPNLFLHSHTDCAIRLIGLLGDGGTLRGKHIHEICA